MTKKKSPHRKERPRPPHIPEWLWARVQATKEAYRQWADADFAAKAGKFLEEEPTEEDQDPA